MTPKAISFYREHPRAIEALATSGCFKPTGSRESSPSLLQRSDQLSELVALTEAFNLFTAMGVSAAEVRHSRFLAWLLDPAGSHGNGATFLRAFFLFVGKKTKESKLIDGVALDQTEVHCEFHCEFGRIDILIVNRTSRFVCAIENKLRIDEGEGQLARYRQFVETNYRGWTCKFVFLTLKEDLPTDRVWLPVSYSELLSGVLSSAVGAPKAGDTAALALLLSDYVRLIRNKAMPSGEANVFEVLHLARTELKHSHFLAWLLRPNGTHGLGTSFARFVLALLERKGVKLPAPASTIDLDDVIVRRERENIDILLVSERHRLVVALENKIGATESATQLDDYDHFLQLHYSGDHLVRIFLDLKGRQATHGGYISVNYEELLPFFDDCLSRMGRPPMSSTKTAILLAQYAALLRDHLWMKRKTVWQLPVSAQRCCEQIAKKDKPATVALLSSVRAWQKELAQKLEGELYEVADRCFGMCFRFTWKSWYSFVPPVFDEMPALRNGGGDKAFKGRLLIYQFFVIPFGDNISVRRPGIFLDVKLIEAEPNHEKVKSKLHEAALEHRIFNRVKRTASIQRNDPLLNHEICSFEEAISCNEVELRRRIAHRMERFTLSIHPAIVSFFHNQLCTEKTKP